jgi:hypothetical protein
MERRDFLSAICGGASSLLSIPVDFLDYGEGMEEEESSESVASGGCVSSSQIDNGWRCKCGRYGVPWTMGDVHHGMDYCIDIRGSGFVGDI